MNSTNYGYTKTLQNKKHLLISINVEVELVSFPTSHNEARNYPAKLQKLKLELTTQKMNRKTNKFLWLESCDNSPKK